jgi:hypothetical protein
MDSIAIITQCKTTNTDEHIDIRLLVNGQVVDGYLFSASKTVQGDYTPVRMRVEPLELSDIEHMPKEQAVSIMRVSALDCIAKLAGVETNEVFRFPRLGGICMEQALEQRILQFAQAYARNHWEVDACAAHISTLKDGSVEHGDYSDDSYLVCLDMPGVGDIQRIVVEVNEDGSLGRDHTYTDDMGCATCQYGDMREY